MRLLVQRISANKPNATDNENAADKVWMALEMAIAAPN
jgi:hypothetical protein